MVDRPPAPATLVVRDTGLTLDQQPATRAVPVDLCSWQQIDVLSQKSLQLSLCLIGGAGASVNEPSSPTRKIESDMPVIVRPQNGQRGLRRT